MADKIFPKSGLPIRKTVDLLPKIFQTEANDKFISGIIDPLVQPGVLEKTVGYIGRRYGKTYNSNDIYLDSDQTLRSRYQLEPGVVIKKDQKHLNFYDYIDFKNQLKFFGNTIERDDLTTAQDHYTWAPPISWDKFVNFREYYWIPSGPPPINVAGQSQEIISTYKVRLGVGSTFIFSPDGLTNNPTITLYRGQVYKFNVNVPDNGFVIRTSYDSTSIVYNSDFPYLKGQFVVFDNKLWQAIVDIVVGSVSSFTNDSTTWAYVEDTQVASLLDYSRGITNNGKIRGTITFKVPMNAPDVLFYQSVSDPNRVGQFVIANIEENTRIDIDDEIIGKSSYVSSNGIEFSNGLVVQFIGKVHPPRFSKDTWLIDGVGSTIRLVKFQDLVPPDVNIFYPEVVFDNVGFDTDPFDEISLLPTKKDYIVINHASVDSNPWSRYNRWFHRSVLVYASLKTGTEFNSPDSARAKRPIIEFSRDLRLFNHGAISKQSVDFIDTFTTDVFSTIEGSAGYIVDGESLFDGARLLVVADTDRLANNKVFEVTFINHTGGQSVGKDWDPRLIYKSGERARLNGLPYTALRNIAPVIVNILSSNSTTRTFRIQKNLAITVDMTVVFDSPIFGNVLADTVYYVISVVNAEVNATEFRISISKRGTEFRPVSTAFADQFMIAHISTDPTGSADWQLAFRVPQISLRPVIDTEPVIDEGVLVKRGARNSGLMFHFNGSTWVESQRKTAVNLAPKFDVFDDLGNSFSDESVYPVSSFTGSSIISYRVGNSITDSELGFSLSYLNINNVGDIMFNFNWDTDIASYIGIESPITQYISSGFYQFSNLQQFGNCWTKMDPIFNQPIIDTVIVSESTAVVISDLVKWKGITDDSIIKTIFFINGVRYLPTVIRNQNEFIFSSLLSIGDVVTIKGFINAAPESGYYEIPIGLEKNPLNSKITSFTIGQATDHLRSGVDLTDEFSGTFPGDGNIRDIPEFTNKCSRLVKHSGITPVALTLICDKQINIVKALEFAGKSYRDFKNNFIALAETLEFDQDPINFVDDILAVMTRVKKPNSPFVDSDMIGTGSFTSLDYKVEDEGITIFALSTKFSLDQVSRQAVYVYKNNRQLLVGRDYQFNSTFGFVELLLPLFQGDRIEIRQYTSTAFSYIPPTPTKLGLYKKYTPSKFFDDTYIVPTDVIQGHDGSITIAYGDYRDDVLLELETRIFNNLKQEYSTAIFDIDSLFGGYYNTAIFTKSQQDDLVARQFRKWATTSRSDFVENTFFDSENAWTFNYNKMSDIGSTTALPGWWRGIYQWFYDTTRPHTCPWEMLGFSQEPVWWIQYYGPAPYTSNNLILWDDLEAGIVRGGLTPGVNSRFVRPGLSLIIPVDANGQLVDPLMANLVGNFSLQSARSSFKFGDVSPVEFSWRSSSDWPFAVMIACSLARPFEFVGENLDKLLVRVNKIGQLVSAATGTFLKVTDIVLPGSNGSQTSGLINYVIDFLRSRNLPVSTFTDKILGIDVNLTTRLSGFVDPSQQKYILDSKNPRAASSSIFIPQENYSIEFNTSVPITTATYSAVIIERVMTGFKVYGYDTIDPVFNYFSAFPTQADPLLSVGGVSENFIEWEPNKLFSNGTIVKLRDSFYRAIKSHTSNTTFELANWRKLPGLPLTGAIQAYRRVNFNVSTTRQLEYGTVFTEIQGLVDFICGYDSYLEAVGFEFNEYDSVLLAPRNWTTSIREFLFWSRHKWSNGALISLSPSANKVVLNTPIGVTETFLDGFYDYQILQVDGSVLPVNAINVNRTFGKTEVSTVDDTVGIFLFKAFLVLKEHVAIFSDTTVFNDVLYSKPTGYRQDRLKSRGFRTVDWDGDYTSPGFIFDNVNIQIWQPFFDYNLGDIVSYKSYLWTSLGSQKGVQAFSPNRWSRLDVVPKKQLVSNFDFRINLFEDFYNVDSDGFGESQRDLARHAIGYQSREYLQDIAEDNVTQFKLFQGFIKEKGTANSIVKVFDKLSNGDKDSIVLNEEWAFNVGKFGGVDQTYQYEFSIEKNKLQLNPQPVLFIDGSISNTLTDQYYRVNNSNFTIAKTPFTSTVMPTSKFAGVSRSAGYVNPADIDIAVKTRDDLLLLDITSIAENSHIWITFDKQSWSVVRFNTTESLVIRDLLIVNNTATFTLNRQHKFKIGDIVGLRDIVDLTGFFKVTAIGSTTFSVEFSSQRTPELDGSSLTYNICILTTVRIHNIASIDLKEAALLPTGAKLWIDDGDGNDNWQVILKQQQYVNKQLSSSLISVPVNIGSSVVYVDSTKISVIGVAGADYAISVVESAMSFDTRQIVAPVFGYEPFCNSSFGSSMAASPDGIWLAVGAPRASGVLSNYVGEWIQLTSYTAGDIVLYSGKLRKAIISHTNSSIADFANNEKWEVVLSVNGNLGASNIGPANQGMVTMFKWQAGQWNSTDVILSPRISENEAFGSAISVSGSAGKYYMAVSAIGALNGTGKVYLFVLSDTTWIPLASPEYQGIFDFAGNYSVGHIVWYNNQLWQASSAVPGDEASSPGTSPLWILIDAISTQGSLPANSAFYDDGSSIPVGLINPDQLIETVKPGDQFGKSVAMSRDGSILVVGVPDGDSEFFPTYKGVWDAFQPYTAGDIIRYLDPLTGRNSYRQLVDPRADPGPDNFIAIGVSPEASPWLGVGDSSVIPTGKVFVYRRNSLDYYALIQTITAGTIDTTNLIGTDGIISSGDKFGQCVDIDWSGNTIIISSPCADINFVSQGTVFVMALTAADTYEVSQVLQSYEEYPNELFGSSISISNRSEKIAVGATQAKFRLPIIFDEGSTIFDNARTRFSEDKGTTGQVYVYEKKDNLYILVEKLQADVTEFESFGESVDISADVVLVGSPDYRILVDPAQLIVGHSYIIDRIGSTDWGSVGATQPQVNSTFIATGTGTGSGVAKELAQTGTARIFRKAPGVNSWQILSIESPLVDIDRINNVTVYDTENNLNLGNIDILDYFKLNIFGIAEQEIRFKTLYDPAIYTVGGQDQEINQSQAWFDNHVGELWWDLSTAKFLYHEQADVSFRTGNFNTLAPFSSIDVYEWVESAVTPAEWAELADTTDGLPFGYSGQPRNDDDSILSIKELYNPDTGELTGNRYYFWVINKDITPTNVPGRRISSSAVSSLILNPGASGLPFISFIAADKLLISNFDSLINSETAVINIEFNKGSIIETPVHNEYQLLTDGVADSLPTSLLERKWIDSLVGYDQAGSIVPDISLIESQRYGTGFRPRQGMFKNRFPVLHDLLLKVNVILASKSFSDILDYSRLSEIDPIPDAVLNQYDAVVNAVLDLQNIGTNKIQRPILSATLVNGKIEDIVIINPGFGFKVAPPIIIEGPGTGASATSIIDAQGRISSVVITNRGTNYASAVVNVRNFSVLVLQDNTFNNYWAIYAWDNVRNEFARSMMQSFDTSKFWEFADWYAPGYSTTSRVFTDVQNLYLLKPDAIVTGGVIRVSEFGSGGWALLVKTPPGTGNILGNYDIVGRYNGTIQFLISKFVPDDKIGYDAVATFDGNVYDYQPTLELRKVLHIIKTDIAIDEFAVEWNKLFFMSVRYAYVQTSYINWAFKTSFLNAEHNVGALSQKPSYKNDNLPSFRKYIEEVKPYRTTIREYKSKYNNLDTSVSLISDFDVPAVFSAEYGKIVPAYLEPEVLGKFPYTNWANAIGYPISAIEVSAPGLNYTNAPSVVITGSGTGATATAFVASGSVSNIFVTNPGSGYLSAPTVSLVGGNGSSQQIAKAVAILGTGAVRTFTLGIKFDRVAKTGRFSVFSQTETFIATGFSSVFYLQFIPSDIRRSFKVTVDGIGVLENEYNISTHLDKGKIVFNTVYALNSVIIISYDRSDTYLDAINRIQKYYSPMSSMKGKELPQLMTGIDYGGVHVQGTTFEVTGGWDALPWFTDNWDSIEPSSDFYYVANGSISVVELPVAPKQGHFISIYLRRSAENGIASITSRIDDVYFSQYDGSTEQPNGQLVAKPTVFMPTFIGNGIIKVVSFINPDTGFPYISINEGDTLIFRPFDSDGSVTITDNNLIDTNLSGGSLSSIAGAYSTAVGKTVAEIIIDGEKFISPTQVPAPEENIPGQVLESVSIKCFNSTPISSAAVQSTVYRSNGVTINYNIGLDIVEANSVMVYINRNRTDAYSIDFVLNSILLTDAPTVGSIIEVIAIGLGGVRLLDYTEIIADGDTNRFLTPAKFDQFNSVLVTVNGNEVSSIIFEELGNSGVIIGSQPGFRDVIKIMTFGYSTGNRSISAPLIRVNQQNFSYDGSTVIYELDKFVDLSSASATSSVVVDANGIQLTGPDTIVNIFDGSNNSFIIGRDPITSAGAITFTDFKVFINNKLQPVITAYTFNINSKVLVINEELLTIRDEIKVVVDVNSDYFVSNSAFVLTPKGQSRISTNDTIQVTWFSEYPSFDIISDQYQGGQLEYKLKKVPINSSYVWVYRNGVRLTKDLDFMVDTHFGITTLLTPTLLADEIKIVEFGTNKWSYPHAFEIFKDMLNVHHYKRYAKSSVRLSRRLSYYDNQIVTTDASGLNDPSISRNLPGVVIINNERIEYFQKSGNVLSQLRRGSLGSPIAEVHTAGSYVIDSSSSETIPYTDEQQRFDFVSDGVTLLIGPLPGIPIKSVIDNWFVSSIPEEYGICNQFEVFVAGTRLRKSPQFQYIELIGPSSPQADIMQEAQFSVDGISRYIRLTEPSPAGTRITVVGRIGRTWYNSGDNTASNGVAMTSSTTPIMKFILQKTSMPPE